MEFKDRVKNLISEGKIDEGVLSKLAGGAARLAGRGLMGGAKLAGRGLMAAGRAAAPHVKAGLKQMGSNAVAGAKAAGKWAVSDGARLAGKATGAAIRGAKDAFGGAKAPQVNTAALAKNAVGRNPNLKRVGPPKPALVQKPGLKLATKNGEPVKEDIITKLKVALHESLAKRAINELNQPVAKKPRKMIPIKTGDSDKMAAIKRAANDSKVRHNQGKNTPTSTFGSNASGNKAMKSVNKTKPTPLNPKGKGAKGSGSGDPAVRGKTINTSRSTGMEGAKADAHEREHAKTLSKIAKKEG